ncbi:MAG: efflux RND transporter periplasmic adaptor subunit [Fimbriimonas sp.]
MKPLIIAIALFAVGCSSEPKHVEGDGHDHSHDHSNEVSKDADHVEGEIKLDAEQIKLAGIEVQPVTKRQIQPSLDFPGVVNPTNVGRAVVTPPVAGRIVSIAVTLGEKVRQGQVLAVLESPELAESWSNIASAERNLETAKATARESAAEVNLAISKLANAKSNLARQQELVKLGAFGQAPLQAAQSDLNDAQSELLSIQREQASHAEVVRRLENLFRDGIVSKSELEVARLELQQDQIRLTRAEARIANAKITYEREKEVSSRGLINAKELQTAQAEVSSAQLELERARIRFRSAQSTAENTKREVENARSVYQSISASGNASVGRVTLTAPISGTLTHLDVTKGQAVDRTQVLMEVENLTAVWVSAQVPEQEAFKVQKGAPVRVTVAGIKGREFPGVVQVVGSRVDPKTRTLPVQCLVTGAADALKPEMFATVHLEFGAGSSVVAVPSSALLREEGKTFVFVQHDGAFHQTEVKLGRQSQGFIEVSSGLAQGDLVVTKGAFVLSSEHKKDELKGHEH